MTEDDPQRMGEHVQLRVQLGRQLMRLETALPGSPEWDAARTAVEELQERLAATEPEDASDGEPPAR